MTDIPAALRREIEAVEEACLAITHPRDSRNPEKEQRVAAARAALCAKVEAIEETARLDGVATVWDHLRRVAKEGLGIIWEPTQGVDVLIDKAKELRSRLVRGEEGDKE